MEAVVRKQTSFRLREDLLQVLQEHAKKANRSLNNFVESTLMNAMYSEPNEETVASIKTESPFFTSKFNCSANPLYIIALICDLPSFSVKYK